LRLALADAAYSSATPPTPIAALIPFNIFRPFITISKEQASMWGMPWSLAATVV
jgi:hypothetical protein